MKYGRDSKGRFVKIHSPKKVSIEERREHDLDRGGATTPHYSHWPKGW